MSAQNGSAPAADSQNGLTVAGVPFSEWTQGLIMGGFESWPLSYPESLLLATAFTFSSVLLVSVLRPSRYPSVRGPRSLPLLGVLPQFLFSGGLKCLATWWKEFGDVFKFEVGLKETLVVVDPELIKEVTVKRFKSFRNRPGPDELPKEVMSGIVLGRDKYWATARGATLAWFHNTEHLANYMGLMTQHLEELCSELDSASEDQVIDIHERLQTLTLDVFCHAAFGATLHDSVDAQASQVARSVADTTKSLSIPTPSSLLALFVPPWAARTLNGTLACIPFTQEYKRKQDIFLRRKIGAQLLATRLKEEQAGAQRKDVLTQLLRAQAKADKDLVKLSHFQLMYILGELILAGSDTTSNTIAFAVFLLATHPKAEAKVVEEIKSLSQEYPSSNVQNLEKYKYIHMVIKEVLRLYPTGAQLFREASEDTMVGSVRIPKGGQIMFPLYLLHRSPKHFPDPDAFIPERFDPDSVEAEKINLAAYLPFGAGPRMCLGTKFALQEASMALIALYIKFTFKMAGDLAGLQGKEAIAALPTDTGIIIKPSKGLHIHVAKRDQ